MTRRLKKIFLTACISLLVLVTFCAGLASCKKQEELKIVFNDQPYVYERGGVADCYDLIQRQEGVAYSFAYDYLTLSEAGETITAPMQQLGGSTIYCNEISRYTVYVTASRDKESLTDSTTFDVIGETPVLLPPSISLVRTKGDYARVRGLLTESSPTVLPASCDIEIDYYTYQETQSPRIEENQNNNIKVKTPVDFANPLTRVYFDKLGEYEFHMIAHNGDRTAEATFKVKVLPDQTAEIDGISAYKNAEFGQTESGEVDSSIIRLIGSTDISQASYAVLEDQFVAGQVARFEFYGKNMPSYIALINQDKENAVDGNSLTNGGRGYCFTVEHSTSAGMYVYGFTRRSTSTSRLKRSTEAYAMEHFSFNDLEDDAHYFFEIACKTTGATTNKDSTKIDKNGNYTYKYGCTDDAALAEKIKDKNVQTVSLHFSLYKVEENGEYKIVSHSSVENCEKSIGGSWFLEGEPVIGKLVAYSSISKDITFKYYKDTLYDNTTFNASQVEFDEETKTLSWESVEGAVNYVVKTEGESWDRIAVLPASQTFIDLSKNYQELATFESLNISVYPSVGNNTFFNGCYQWLIVKGTQGFEDTMVNGTVLNYDEHSLSVSLLGEKGQSAGDFQKEVDYVAFTDEYVLDENGTYVDVYFTGNNMPQVEFFATDVLGNICNKAGDTQSRGFVVTNGHAHQSAYSPEPNGSYGGYANYELFYKYGVTTYDRLVSGSSLGGARITDWIVDGKYDCIVKSAKKDENGNVIKDENGNNVIISTPTSLPYSNFSMYSLMIKNPQTQNYRYTVGMFKASENGSVWLDSKLYKVDGNTETLFAQWLSPVLINAQVKVDNVITEPAQYALNDGQTISGKIVLHAAYKGSLDSSAGEKAYNTFTCSKPYAGQASTHTALISGGIKDEATGEVKLNGGVYNNGTSYEKNAGYLAFKNINATDGKFVLDENGWYVDFYFTGNNMPNVEFFGSSISGNMFNDNTNKGYVVTNGNGHATLYRNYNAVTTKELWNTDLTGTYVNGGTNNTLTYDPISFKYNGVTNYKAFFKYGVSDYNKYSQDIYAACDERNTLGYTYLNNSVWTTNTSMTYSAFSMYALMADEAQSWKYTVGMYLGTDNKVYLDAKLYKAGETTAFASYNAEVETLETGVVRAGYIVAHAALKGTAQFDSPFYTTFTYTAPYARDQ